MPKKSTTTSQLTLGALRARRLTDEARTLLAELGRLHEQHDSARLMSALGMLSMATGLLADVGGELGQAARVAQATSKE